MTRTTHLFACVAVLTFGGYISNQVWYTSDGGGSWAVRSGAGANALPAIQVNTIRFHPFVLGWVYIGTDLGIFASEDFGLTWSVLPVYASNEGPANVEVDELFWQGTDYLLAATHGRGMFRTRIQPGVFVDQSNPNPGDGTFGNPFKQIQDGINLQIAGTPLYIRTGTYQQGPVTFSKRGRVVGWNGPLIIK